MNGRNWDDVFGDLGQQQAARLTRLPLAALDPWTDEAGKPQPFKPYTQAQMEELTENIRVNGVIEPIRARPMPSGRFQIIAGHNRVEAARRAGLTTVPAIVEEADDARAAIMLVDSNLQHREKLLPSELAFAYKLKLDNLPKRKAGRPSKNEGQLVPHLPSEKRLL